VEGAGGGTATRRRTSLVAWKHAAKPSDLTISRVYAQGKTWKLHTKCNSGVTNAIGIYHLSHYDLEHIENYHRPVATAVSPAAPLATTAATAPIEESPAAPKRSRRPLTSVANPNPILRGSPDIALRNSVLPRQKIYKIEFAGMWCALVEAHFLDVRYCPLLLSGMIASFLMPTPLKCGALLWNMPPMPTISLSVMSSPLSFLSSICIGISLNLDYCPSHSRP
jgi:hypothetical protein